jgi:hypothetical protein
MTLYGIRDGLNEVSQREMAYTNIS